MRTILKSGFVRYFISGFALGTLGLVALEAAHAEPQTPMPGYEATAPIQG